MTDVYSTRNVPYPTSLLASVYRVSENQLRLDGLTPERDESRMSALPACKTKTKAELKLACDFVLGSLGQFYRQLLGAYISQNEIE